MERAGKLLIKVARYIPLLALAAVVAVRAANVAPLDEGSGGDLIWHEGWL